MKATIPQLKKKIQLMTFNTGLMLVEGNEYWANEQQIQYIEEAIEQIKQDGETLPEFKYEITDAQLSSLNEWVAGLKRKFLMEM